MGQTDSKTDKHAPLASKVRHSTCSTMKSLLSPKHRFLHPTDPPRTNLYETTTPIGTVQRRQRPVVPLRTDSTRSLTRSLDTSSSSSTSIDHDSSINNKSQSIYEYFHSTTNGHFLPLQSVREDESFEEMNEKSSKMPHDQHRLLIETVKDKYTRQFGSSMENDSNKSVLPTGFSRQERLRSSLPFIIKPAAKSNSLGLCFLICENETKKVLLPPFISCMDTLKALFVRAFPHQLTMKQMEMDHLKIYIREMEKDIFYQLEDLKDVKDRSVLKLVHVSPVLKGHVSFKETDVDDSLSTRLSRLTRISNEDEKSSSNDLSRSLSEPRNRFISPEPLSIHSSLKTTRSDETEARIKIELMERQLEALTDLVKDLTQQQHKPNRINEWIGSHGKSLHEQLKDLKIRTHSLRDDLSDLRRMQHSLHETFQLELEQANRKIEEQLMHFNEQNRPTRIEENFDFYIKTSSKINRDLEDLQIAVEQLQNDVKMKRCFITIHDVECFALVLSTISRTLVDLKSSFPSLREKLFRSDQSSMIKFLHEEPERLDFTIKKCKRLTAMLYQLKRLAVNEEQRCRKPLGITLKTSSSIDHRSLMEEIQSISINSDERMKAIEISEKLRERRLEYEHRLETLKQMKASPEKDVAADNQSLTNSFSTRTSLCSTDSNHCPSPSLSYLVRRALNSTGTVKDEPKIQVSSKPSSKVTFSHQLITPQKPSNDPSMTKTNKKVKPTPPPRIQSTSSSSAVSSASSSLSSCTGGNGHSSRLTNGFCGILPLLSPERRHHGRCYSFSSSSTDTDSAVSNLPPPPPPPPPAITTATMRVSVTDL